MINPIRSLARLLMAAGALNAPAARALTTSRIPMPDWPSWMKHLEFRLTEEQLEFPQAYALLPDIFSCVSTVQDAIAALPVQFYVTDLQGNETILERGENPLADLFYAGNKLETGYDVWHSLVGHYLINENGYLFLDYSDVNFANARSVNTKLLPSSVWALPSHLVTIVLGDNRTIEAFKLWNGGANPITLPPEQVVHIAGFNTDPNGMGLSRLNPLNLTYHTQRDAERYEREVLKRGGQTAGVYSTEQGMGPEERARLVEELRVEEGVESYFRPALLPKGLKYVRSGLTHQELQFLEVGEWNTHKICRVFHVPPSFLGIRVGGLGASDKGIEQDMLLLIRHAMQPITRRIEERINEHLFGRRFGMPMLRLRFDYSNEVALQSVFLSQADAYQKATGRPVLTVNEARGRMGLPPHEDPTADELFSPLLLNAQAAALIDGAGPPDPNAMSEADRPIEAILRDATGEQDMLHRRVADAEVEQWAAVAEPRIRRLFRDQEQRLIDRLRALNERSEVAGETRFARVLDVDVLLTALDNETDRALVRKLLRMISERVGEKAIHEIARDLMFSVDASRASAAIKKQGVGMVTHINATTADALRTSLADGIAASEPTLELIDRVRTAFRGRRATAPRIARTEAHAAINTARLEGWQQGVEALKIKARKRWLTSEDEMVRGTPGGPYEDSEFSHFHADGQEVDIEQPFVVGAHAQGKGEGCMAPGDMHLSAGNRINCRCTMLLVLDKPSDNAASTPVEDILAR